MSKGFITQRGEGAGLWRGGREGGGVPGLGGEVRCVGQVPRVLEAHDVAQVLLNPGHRVLEAERGELTEPATVVVVGEHVRLVDRKTRGENALLARVMA